MKLQLNEKVPEFTLVDKDGNLFYSNSVIGKKVCVLFFYPKNFTPGCTKEVCDFRDNYQEFMQNGAEVIGISSDSVASHKRFSEKYTLPHILLSDPTEEIRKRFGVKGHLLGLIPGRETFVVDKQGKLRLKFNNLSSKDHVQKALKTVKKLQDE